MSLGIELNQIVARCVKDRNQGHRLLGPVNVTLDLEASWSEDQILQVFSIYSLNSSLGDITPISFFNKFSKYTVVWSD